MERVLDNLVNNALRYSNQRVADQPDAAGFARVAAGRR
jgi:signal transduction histidine kinase